MQVTQAWTPIGYARFASLASAVIVGTATPTAGTAYTALVDGFGTKVEPNHAIVTVETQPVRLRSDGTSPTTTEGELVKADRDYVISDSPDEIRKLRIIETTASAQVTVRYYI